MDAAEAFAKNISGESLTVEGKVIKILPDDHEGIHHQRFIIETPKEQTILVVNNLERSYRAPCIVGDNVEVHGTYEWNKFGGIVHNTHHDDRDSCRRIKSGKVVCGPSHEDGWIVFVGMKDPHRTKNVRQKP